MPGWVSPWELIILAIVLLLVFGSRRLPEIGRSLGQGMREFKQSVTGKDDEPGSPASELELPAAPAAEEPTATSKKRKRARGAVS